MFRCLVNLVALDPPRNGGTSRIAREVSRLLLEEARTNADLRVVFVVGWRFAGQFADWLGEPAVVVPYAWRGDTLRLMRAVRPDLIISPLFGMEPFQHASAPHVAGMPDALLFDHPEGFSEAERRYRFPLYAALRGAAAVVTLSEHARARLTHHLQIAPERIAVVPLGAELPHDRDAAAPPTDAPYVFYPANLWPHKRHELLLRIMHAVWVRRPDIRLVLSGGRAGEELPTLLARHNVPAASVIDLGYISNAALRAAYRHAQALLFVSAYEGFGMPLVEAMLNDCPVICAPLASMPEVAGDAALYVDSEQPEAWASALLDVLPQQRDALIIAGRQRARRYTWERARAGWRAVLRQAGLPDAPAASTAPYEAPVSLDALRSLAGAPSGSLMNKARAAPRLFAVQAAAYRVLARYLDS